MYKTFFNLNENPFLISPDPKYLYMSERHTEALTHLLYGLENSGGFVLLTGEVGTGKTTISRCLFKQIPPNTILATLLNPTLSTEALLASICDAFNLSFPPASDIKYLFDTLNIFLQENHQNGMKTVLVIDEAQHLIPEVLEQLRLLTNIETDQSKLLSIILIGQPELQQLIRQPRLRQLAQRITARYHLLPLEVSDVDAYVRFRLQVAGCLQPIFTPPAIRALHRLSGGIPRVINLICERSLLGAFAGGVERITEKLLAKAAYEATGIHNNDKTYTLVPYLLAGFIMVMFGWFGWQTFGYQPIAPVKQLIVPVIQPADSKIVKHYKQAIANSSYEDQAIQQLYRIWGYETAIDEASCKNAERVNLGCIQAQGSLDELLKLNYPAVIRLTDKSGLDFYAVLFHVNEDEFNIFLANEHWVVSKNWLNTVWNNDYTILWQKPDSGNTEITKNSNIDDIYWLDKAVDQSLHLPIRKKLALFDTDLENKVREFQKKEGLKTDGIAGEQTLLHLSIRSRSTVPKLFGSIPSQKLTTEYDENQNIKGTN